MKKSRKKLLLRIAIGFVGVNLIVWAAIPLLIMNSMLDRHVNFEKTWQAEEVGLEAAHFFVETQDGLDISAWEVETQAPKAVVICLSGMHGPSATIYFGHAELFSEVGFATLILDMRAHGESDGDKISVGYREWRDVQAAVDHVRSKPLYDGVPIVVFGASMGGVTAINAAGEIPQIDAVIALSAFASWEQVFCEQMEQQVGSFVAAIEAPFVPLASYLKFGSESRRVKPRLEIEKLGDRPALLMHSKGDTQVPYSNFERLMQHAPAHVETFVRDGDLHFMTEHFHDPKADAPYAEAIVGFIARAIL